MVNAETGLRLIVGFKLLKSLVQFAGGFITLTLASAPIASLQDLLQRLHQHAHFAHLSEELSLLATPRMLLVAALILLFDGVLSFVEGWALHRRRPWAEWLLVIASACPLPIELYALVVHPGVVTCAAAAVNLTILSYLLLRRRKGLLFRPAAPHRMGVRA